MKSKLFLLLLVILIQSCKTKNIIDGYIIQKNIVDKHKKIDYSIDNFFLPIDQMMSDKNSLNSYFYLRFPDIKEVSLCCQDSTYSLNRIQKQEVYKLIEDENYNYLDLAENSKYFSLSLNDTLKVKIFKVKTKHCYCSNKYSLFPKMSNNKNIIYVFDCLYYKLTNKEKKYFKNQKKKILEEIGNN